MLAAGGAFISEAEQHVEDAGDPALSSESAAQVLAIDRAVVDLRVRESRCHPTHQSQGALAQSPHVGGGHGPARGAVAGVVGIEGGVVSEVIGLES